MKKKALLYLRWVTALAALLILSCIGYHCILLYQSNAKPVFSAEKVADALHQASPLLIACLLWIGLSVLLSIGTPALSRPKPLSAENRLRLMKKQLSSFPPEAKQEEKRRLFIHLFAAAGILFCILWCLLFLLNRANFLSWNLEQVMAKMLQHVVPALIAAGLIGYIAIVLCDRSRKKECRQLQSLAKTERTCNCAPKNTLIFPVRIFLMTIALLFIVLGALNGGMQDMMNKAIKICTECIGLG